MYGLATLTRGLSGDTLKNVVNEGVKDGHSLVGNASIGVNLLENCACRVSAGVIICKGATHTLVDVGRVGLLPDLFPLLLVTVSRRGRLLSCRRLLSLGS